MPAFPARCCERSVKLASNRTVVPCVAKSTPRQETIHVRCGARPLVLTKMPSTTVDECGRMMRSSQHGATTFPVRLLVGNAVLSKAVDGVPLVNWMFPLLLMCATLKFAL